MSAGCTRGKFSCHWHHHFGGGGHDHALVFPRSFVGELEGKCSFATTSHQADADGTLLFMFYNDSNNNNENGRKIAKTTVAFVFRFVVCFFCCCLLI